MVWRPGGLVKTHACVQVFDEDPGKDDPMGHLNLDLGRIVRERSTSPPVHQSTSPPVHQSTSVPLHQHTRSLVKQWEALEGCKSGEVLLSATYRPSLPSRSSSLRLDVWEKKTLDGLSGRWR